MKKILRLIKDYFKLIWEGESFKDKSIIFLHFIKIPLRAYYRIINHKYPHFLTSDITLKNKDGIFFCGSSSLVMWGGSSFYESKIRKYINLKKGVFVDVGANMGKHTVVLSKQLNKNGKVIAIEPEPNNFKILEKNIKLNKLKNVIPLNLACYDSNGFLDLYLDAEGAGTGHSLAEKVGPKISVKIRTLDNILKELKIKKVDIIKIDVEGAEPNVLKGATKILKKDHPKIIFEALDNKGLNKTKKVLSEFGYKIEEIDSTNYFAY